jgi:hypothetical protein
MSGNFKLGHFTSGYVRLRQYISVRTSYIRLSQVRLIQVISGNITVEVMSVSLSLFRLGYVR